MTKRACKLAMHHLSHLLLVHPFSVFLRVKWLVSHPDQVDKWLEALTTQGTMFAASSAVCCALNASYSSAVKRLGLCLTCSVRNH